MAYAADEITNGFSALFSCESHREKLHPFELNNEGKLIRGRYDFKRGMCFFHMNKATEDHISFLNLKGGKMRSYV